MERTSESTIDRRQRVWIRNYRRTVFLDWIGNDNWRRKCMHSDRLSYQLHRAQDDDAVARYPVHIGMAINHLRPEYHNANCWTCSAWRFVGNLF